MVINDKEVLGLKLYSLQEGEIEGVVKNLIVDTLSNKLTAFLIEENNAGVISESLIPFNNVIIIGSNALIIESSGLLRSTADESIGYGKTNKKPSGRISFDSKTGEVFRKNSSLDDNGMFAE